MTDKNPHRPFTPGPAMMARIKELLDKLPFSRSFLVILLFIALVVYQYEDPKVEADGALANWQDEVDARKGRVNASIDSLEIDDENLLRCIRKSAQDRANIHPSSSGGIDDVRALKLLYCRSASIRTLRGIEELQNLTYIDLSKNSVRSLDPLRNLKKLKSLHIRDNPLGSIGLVASLPGLRELYLPDLPDVPCVDIALLVGSLRSNFKSIQCDGPRSGESKTVVLKGGGGTGSDEFEAFDELTDAQQQELLEYERDARHRR